ncbi:CPBP family intramembrane glutamic endopeptidase [Maribacter arcticus]|uniref:CPBP family intramembrane glutamic endopeptidase n=1 Tax=Maribacter arcticus TaxID=561365 RepID=UPI00300130D0
MLPELIVFAKKPIYAQDVNSKTSDKLRLFSILLVLALCSSIILLILASVIQLIFNIEVGEHAIDDLFNNNSEIKIFFLAVIVAPFFEELIFRGPLIFFKNSKYFPIILYIFTIAFGLVHISNFELTTQVLLLSPLLVAPQISVGFLLGYIRVKFGLFWSMALHACYNMVLIVPLLLVKLLDIPLE